MFDPEDDTIDLISRELFAAKFFASATPPIQLSFGAASHTGKVRRSNEDHYAVVRRRRTTELIDSNLAPEDMALGDDFAYALAVADGMGGAKFGEFASRLALQTVFELAQRATSWVMKLTDMDAQQIQQRVDAYVHSIQATLREHIEADPSLAGMGTTWTSAHLLPPHALVVHIGDSRAYQLSAGELHQITRDETMAQALIDSGVDAEKVKNFRHVLVNALGGDSNNVTAQLYHLETVPGDQLLLCTDGLTDMVADEDIRTILLRSKDPQSACDQLVQAALHNGGKDNITVVLASFA